MGLEERKKEAAYLSFPPVVTSSSSRDYVVNSPDGATETRTYQWRQTITFQSCQHADSWRDVKPTQLLSVDNVLALYDSSEVMRFTMTNKIGDVHGEVLVVFLFGLCSHPACRSHTAQHPVRTPGGSQNRAGAEPEPEPGRAAASISSPQFNLYSCLRGLFESGPSFNPLF